LLRKGSETTGRVSEANRGARTARSAPTVPKPKTNRRLGLGRNTCRWFRIGNQRAAALRYLWDFFDSLNRGVLPSDTLLLTYGALLFLSDHPFDVQAVAHGGVVDKHLVAPQGRMVQGHQPLHPFLASCSAIRSARSYRYTQRSVFSSSCVSRAAFSSISACKRM